MPAQPATYDLVLLLDPEAEEHARARPLAEARAAIESQGELVRHDEWGSRTLTYAINRRSAAEYHLLQFRAGSPELLRALDRSLRIADEVLRFRIVKLRPGVPEPPDMRATATAPAPRGAPAPQARDAERAGAAQPADEPAASAEGVPGAGEGDPGAQGTGAREEAAPDAGEGEEAAQAAADAEAKDAS